MSTEEGVLCRREEKLRADSFVRLPGWRGGRAPGQGSLLSEQGVRQGGKRGVRGQ